MIIRDMLFLKKKSFNEFLESPEGIATNILTERLKRLEESGIILKRPYQKTPLRNEYILTRRGEELRTLLIEMIRWGNVHIEGTIVPPKEFLNTFGFMPIRTILLLVSLVSMIAGGVQIMMPVFARDIFHGGATMLGLLMGSSGLGALIGAMYLASRKNVLGLGKVIVTACFLFGSGMIGFVISPTLWLSLVMLVVCGFGMIVQMSASNTVLQSMVEENKRGRVMSFYAMAFMGMAPFGSLLAGVLTHHLRASTVFIAGGIGVIFGGVLFAFQLPRLRELVRPLYIQKGIIPDMMH